MIKKMIIAATALSFVATPLAARERHKRDHPRQEQRHGENDKQHRHGGGGILGFIAGVLVGTAVAGRDYDARPRYYGYPPPSGMPPYEPYRPNVYPYNQYYCATEQHVDYYGNIYYTRRCNY